MNKTDLQLTSAVTTGDYAALESLAVNAVKEKQVFERLIVSKEDLLKMFEVCTNSLDKTSFNKF